MLNNNQKAQLTTLLQDINKIMMRELATNKGFTGHIIFDVSCTSGGICETIARVNKVLPIRKEK